MNNENKENIYSVERTHKVDITSKIEKMNIKFHVGKSDTIIHADDNIFTVIIKIKTCSDIDNEIIEKIAHANNDICKIISKWIANGADTESLLEYMEDFSKILNDLRNLK